MTLFEDLDGNAHPNPKLIYIGDMLAQLARMAEGEGQTELAIAIRLAALQAETGSQTSRTPN
jgi:hypothetical protein